MTKKIFFVFGAVLGLAVLGAGLQYLQPAKLPIDQTYIVTPEREGVLCEQGKDENGELGLTLCQMKEDLTEADFDGRNYRLLTYITDDAGQVLWFMGSFRKDGFEDALSEYTSRFGKPDDQLGEAGDRRAIWFLQNGVAMMRERSSKMGEGSSALSLFCFQSKDDERLKKLGQPCQKFFKPSAVE